MSQIYLICATVPCLLVLCWYDCKYRKLPNVLTLGLAGLALLCRIFLPGPDGVLNSVLDGLGGGLICGLFLFLPFLFRSAGGGDVKMLFATGIIVGFKYSLTELLFVSLAGVVLAILLLCFGLVGGTRLKHYLRVLFDWRYDRKAGAEKLPPKKDERGRIPFGVAIAAGTLATLIWAYYRELPQ